MDFLLFLILPAIVGIWAQMKVKGTYSKYVQVPSRGRITGREAAAAVMQSAGIHDVEIVKCHGVLTDHYDPNNKRLALSQENYHGTSLAALGVAAHEAGHAIQHKEAYKPLNLRMALVPITSFASQLLPIFILGSLFLMGPRSGPFLLLGIGIYIVLTLFQLITLPVEFDASKRAKAQLVNLGIIGQDELTGVNKTLDAAAYTYVAAFVSSLGWLLYLIAGARRD
ncbi:zinc metallopeptidase [Coraliomargarita akajimensis]|uniref:Peptidase membrane zinc metallopeptidase putative n=1 Tax=Coraliomargarita akajimensis (strain DSM 45221 / IAM 15411 / JCM 23193 / KCTC 12865 / 04OKA010-24) TaxID=583355 RepID=D5EM79_CORAD|nr:zinc metallopeptidase [Coraliomargarita akajimensis]ADE55239.1 peptidase membrane zinc metallopeptidase putative [Coraliomargarita akajimensis DSM 45221]